MRGICCQVQVILNKMLISLPRDPVPVAMLDGVRHCRVGSGFVCVVGPSNWEGSIAH